MKAIDGDQPIVSSKDDKFGREQFAHRIVEVLVNREDSSSLVVGVTAPWGEGKTSVLNMIREKLDSSGVPTVMFNPWRYPDEDKLLKNFYRNLAESLDLQLETDAEVTGARIRKNAKVFALAKIFGVDGEEAAGGFGALFPEAELEELKGRIESSLRERGSRIVVLIDDIDRLDVEEIQAVFRLIKLSASFPNLSYVVAFDEARVAEALGLKFGQNPESGRKFLEKILQVTLPLPPASSQILLSSTVDGINSVMEVLSIETDDNQSKRFSEHFTKAFGSRITSPRLVKRFLNAIAFALPLLKGEVNPTDLIFLEAIKIFYPDLYLALRTNGEAILNFTVGDRILGSRDDQIGSDLDAAIKQAISHIPDGTKLAIGSVVQDLFPGLSTLPSLSRPYRVYPEEDRMVTKRISTREYFWRYFSYGVQPQDVSDNEISSFLETIEHRGAEFVDETLRRYFSETPSRIDVVVNKLRLHEDTLESSTAVLLAEGLGKLSDEFPRSHPDDRFLIADTRTQIARLLMHLAKSLDQSECESLLVRLAAETPDVLFSYDLAEMMRAFGERIDTTDKSWVVVNHGTERLVNQTVAKRIADFATQGALEDWNFGWAQDLYLFWFHHDAASLQVYFKTRFDEGSDSLIRCLGAFIRFDPTGTKNFSSYVSRELPLIAIADSLCNLDEVAARFEQDFPAVGRADDSENRTNQFVTQFLDGYNELRSRRSRVIASGS
jgi:hypothetical protein